jgi:hypothetical protein
MAGEKAETVAPVTSPDTAKGRRDVSFTDPDRRVYFDAKARTAEQRTPSFTRSTGRPRCRPRQCQRDHAQARQELFESYTQCRRV